MMVSIMGDSSTKLCQISALREGFAALGHQHTLDCGHPDNAFIFCGNPPFESYLNYVGHKKLILNVLDIPIHLNNVGDIIERLKAQLPLANKVTTISKTVAAQLKEHCGVDAEVIYYPMKPVRKTGDRKYPRFRAVLVGRLQDSNKFSSVAVSALVRAGFNESEVAIVGPEYFGWGVRMGVVSDEVLNDIYNSVDYVVMTSRIEGIGLPAIEAACCGAIPIVASHLSTLQEFWVESPLGLNYQTLNSVDAITKLLLSIEADPIWKAQLKEGFLKYGAEVFRPKFEKEKVADRLVRVALSIPN